MTIEEVYEHLHQSLGNKAYVKMGWVNEIKDFTTPVVSITTYNHWPNHADVNMWAHTIEDRDLITESVIKTLQSMKKDGIVINSTRVIQSEEKGVLQPESGKVIEKTKPIFRKLVQISFK